MSKSVLILATHVINEGIISEYRKMKNTPNIDAVLMVDNNNKRQEAKEHIETRTYFGTEVTCFFFDVGIHDELKLPYYPARRGRFGTIMWYNADYRFYYFRHYFPDYEYYWLIEYDVFFNTTDGTYSAFVERYDQRTSDFIGPHLSERKLDAEWDVSHDIHWAYEDHVYGAVFPVIRLSRKAIDFLYKKRLEHVNMYEAATGKKRWVFVEAFVPTELKNNGFSISETHEPHVHPNPPISLNDNRVFEKPDDLLYHPIKSVNTSLLKEIGKFNDAKKEFWLEQEELASHFTGTCISTYAQAIRNSPWFRNQSAALGEENPQEVSWKYLLALYRLLDEYHPKTILELNLGQATKMTAQYAAQFHAAHSILEHDRERVEHYMKCWNVPWQNTTIYGSPLLKMNHEEHGDIQGVIFKEFPSVTANKKYDLILVKCPAFEKGIHIQLDLLPALPQILQDNFAILMDHIEDPCGHMVLEDMENILKGREVKFLRKDFLEPGRKCCILASESWKYIMEF